MSTCVQEIEKAPLSDLPSELRKFREFPMNPTRSGGFYAFCKFNRGDIFSEVDEEVNVIRDAADLQRGALPCRE